MPWAKAFIARTLLSTTARTSVGPGKLSSSSGKASRRDARRSGGFKTSPFLAHEEFPGPSFLPNHGFANKDSVGSCFVQSESSQPQDSCSLLVDHHSMFMTSRTFPHCINATLTQDGLVQHFLQSLSSLPNRKMPDLCSPYPSQAQANPHAQPGSAKKLGAKG